jgi:hypothetical protein
MGHQMSATDIFFSLCVISLILGIIAMTFSYADVTALGYISNAVSTLPNIQGPATLSADLTNFSYFFPDLAAMATLILVASSLMLSWYLKAALLAAIGAIFMLIVYTIASFFISNVAVQIAHLGIYSTIISHANLLLLIWINMPSLLVLFCVVDIGIALTAAFR